MNRKIVVALVAVNAGVLVHHSIAIRKIYGVVQDFAEATMEYLDKQEQISVDVIFEEMTEDLED